MHLRDDEANLAVNASAKLQRETRVADFFAAQLNDKTLRKILIGVAIVAVIILIVNGLYRRSNYVFPPTDTAQEDNTLNTQVQECQTTYSQAILAGTDATTAQAALKTCVSGKVSTYITAKSPNTICD